MSLFSTLQLAQILPTEENFLLCFREFVGSSSEFMTVSLCLCHLSQSLTSSSSACHEPIFVIMKILLPPGLSLPVGCSVTNCSTSLSCEISPRTPEVSSDISGSPLGRTLICYVIVPPFSRHVFICGSSPVIGIIFSERMYLKQQITLWGDFASQYSGSQACELKYVGRASSSCLAPYFHAHQERTSWEIKRAVDYDWTQPVSKHVQCTRACFEGGFRRWCDVLCAQCSKAILRPLAIHYEWSAALCSGRGSECCWRRSTVHIWEILYSHAIAGQTSLLHPPHKPPTPIHFSVSDTDTQLSHGDTRRASHSC